MTDTHDPFSFAFPQGRPIAVESAPCEHCGEDEIHVGNCVVAVAERTSDPGPPPPGYSYAVEDVAGQVLACERSARRGMDALAERLGWESVPEEIMQAHLDAERQLTRWFEANGDTLLLRVPRGGQQPRMVG